MAGLAAAHQLSREGLRVLVLEQSDEPGGRARSEEWEGRTIELGASFVTPAYRRLRRLINECGLEDRLARMPNAFRTAIRRDGKWHYLDFRWPEIELVRYSGISSREKRSLVRLVPSQLRSALAARFFFMASAAAVDSTPLEDLVGPAANRYFASPVAEVFCSYPPEEFQWLSGCSAPAIRPGDPRSWRCGLGSLPGELARRLDVRFRIPNPNVAEIERFAPIEACDSLSP